jgi:uncharacterized OB-fold protein
MTDTIKEASTASGPEQTYFRYLKAGTWMLPQCTQCRNFCFYPRVVCPSCGSQHFNWVRPSGNGVVHATTVMRRSTEAGGDVNLCLVDLDEGVRMMSRVVGTDPGKVKIGDRLHAFLSESDEDNKVYFKIVGQHA